MKKNNIKSSNSITILVSPWEKGFSCGVINESANKMTYEQFKLCNTIARGMCYVANHQPDKIFKLGKKTSIEKKDNSNVIDFLKFLQTKRERN